MSLWHCGSQRRTRSATHTQFEFRVRLRNRSRTSNRSIQVRDDDNDSPHKNSHSSHIFRLEKALSQTRNSIQGKRVNDSPHLSRPLFFTCCLFFFGPLHLFHLFVLTFRVLPQPTEKVILTHGFVSSGSFCAMKLPSSKCSLNLVHFSLSFNFASVSCPVWYPLFLLVLECFSTFSRALFVQQRCSTASAPDGIEHTTSTSCSSLTPRHSGSLFLPCRAPFLIFSVWS